MYIATFLDHRNKAEKTGKNKSTENEIGHDKKASEVLVRLIESVL